MHEPSSPVRLRGTRSGCKLKVMASVYRTVTAWRHPLESLLWLGSQLSDVQWLAPTQCPGWTVKDIFAHVIGGEEWMADGHPPPTQGVAAWALQPVQARRGLPASTILCQLRAVYEHRRVQLGKQQIDPEQPAHMVTGKQAPLGLLLRFRVLDLWVHEQDVRRAVGRPGNLASPAAALSGELLVAEFPDIVAGLAQISPGTTVRLTTTGQVPVDLVATIDASGGGVLMPAQDTVTTHLTMSWEAYTRLSCGRGAPADYEISISGDQALATSVLAHLPITP